MTENGNRRYGQLEDMVQCRDGRARRKKSRLILQTTERCHFGKFPAAYPVAFSKLATNVEWRQAQIRSDRLSHSKPIPSGPGGHVSDLSLEIIPDFSVTCLLESYGPATDSVPQYNYPEISKDLPTELNITVNSNSALFHTIYQHLSQSKISTEIIIIIIIIIKTDKFSVPYVKKTART